VFVDVARVVAAAAMLGYGSYRDLEERRVPNQVWYPFAALGFFLDGLVLIGESGAFFVGRFFLLAPLVYLGLHLGFSEEAWDRFFDRFFEVPGSVALVYVLSFALPVAGLFASSVLGSAALFDLSSSVLVAVLLVVLIGWIGKLVGSRLMGGADLKALLTLSVLLPAFPGWAFEPGLFGLPVVTVLMNGLILGALYPLTLFLYNLSRGDVEFRTMFLGFRRDVDEVDAGKTRLLESVSDSGEVVVVSPGSVEASEEELARLRRAGVEEVWVTYLIPFVVLLFVGLLVAVTYGDLYTGLVRAMM